MMLSFYAKIDKGSPKFDNLAGVHAIINATAGDKGRWIADQSEPLISGSEYSLTGSVKTTAPKIILALVWFANEAGKIVHSVERPVELDGPFSEYRPFTYHVVVPNDVKLLQVELRGRSGAGRFDFKDIQLIKIGDDPDPDPDPQPEPEPSMITLSIIVGKVRWRVTASEESITFLRLNHEPFNKPARAYFID